MKGKKMARKDINYVDGLASIKYTSVDCDKNGNASLSASKVAITPADNGTIIVKDANVTHIKVKSSSAVKLTLDDCPKLEYIELPGANTPSQVENQVTIYAKGKPTLQQSLLINGTMKEIFALWGTDETNPFVIYETYDSAESGKGLISLLDCGFIGTSWDIDLGLDALQVDLLVIDQTAIRSNPLRDGSRTSAKLSKTTNNDDTIELDAQVVSLKNFPSLERVCVTDRVRCLYLENCASLTSVLPTANTVKTSFGHGDKAIQARVNAARKKAAVEADEDVKGTCSLSVLDIVNCADFNYYFGSTTYLGLTSVKVDTVQIKGKIDTLWSDSNRIRILACVAPEKMYFAGKGAGEDGIYCSIQNIYADKVAGKTQPNCCAYADEDDAALPYLYGPFFDPTSSDNKDLAWAPAASEKALNIEWGYIIESGDALRARGFMNWCKVQTEESDIVKAINCLYMGAKTAISKQNPDAFSIPIAWEGLLSLMNTSKSPTWYVPAEYPRLLATDTDKVRESKIEKRNMHNLAWQGSAYLLGRAYRDGVKGAAQWCDSHLNQSFAPVQLYYLTKMIITTKWGKNPDAVVALSDLIIDSLKFLKETVANGSFVSKWVTSAGYPLPKTTETTVNAVYAKKEAKTALNFMFAKSDSGALSQSQSLFDHEYNARFLRRLVLLLCNIDVTTDDEDENEISEPFDKDSWPEGFKQFEISCALADFFKAYPLVEEMYPLITMLQTRGIDTMQDSEFGFLNVAKKQGMDQKQAYEVADTLGTRGYYDIRDEEGKQVSIPKFGMDFKRMGFVKNNPKAKKSRSMSSRHNPAYDDSYDDDDYSDSRNYYDEMQQSSRYSSAHENPAHRHMSRRGLMGRR